MHTALQKAGKGEAKVNSLKKYFYGLGVGTAIVIAGLSLWAAVHLWEDHSHYHPNMQLLELVRATIVEMHPELLPEDTP